MSNFWCYIGLHDWSRWSQPKTIHYVDASFKVVTGQAKTQERTCKQCGKMEERYID